MTDTTASKRWLALSAASLLAVSLTACSGSGKDENGNKGADGTAPSPAQQPKTAAKLEPKKDSVELVFYSASGDFDNDGFMKMFGNKIKEKFPHVTVKFLPYNSANLMDKMIAAGQTLDILYYSTGQTGDLLDYKLQYDISDLVKGYGFDLEKLEPTAVDFQRKLAKGGLYGLPVFNNTLTLFYNKDLFDKFGVPYPKDGLTWDGLYDIAKTMSRVDGGEQYHGLTLSMSHSMLLNQLSLPYIDATTQKVNFDSDTFKKLFDTWTSMYQIPGNEVDKKTVDFGSQVNMFDKDKKAAMFMGLSALGPSRFKEAVNWDVASYPVFADKPGVGPQPYPSYFYVTNTSKYKEQAFEVIAYLASEEFQLHLAKNGLLPALKNRDEAMKQYGADIPYLKTKNASALMPKQFAPLSMTTKEQLLANTKAYNSLLPAYNAVVLKEKDKNTALREAEEQGNKDIAAFLETKK
ncbi:ABC transporter substrate-binding protein [Paenibacillus hodogayensis]|uniref:ABC transporter substrate-binding protein n=1 Tax=Paenibacillus hodogayensis TaxID=279208 RepID=A0ABV5VS93_9BACL